MDKIFLILLLLVFPKNYYIDLEYLGYYQTNEASKEFIFGFKSDYYSAHDLSVYITFYDENSNYLVSYSNNLSIIGNVKKIAQINFDYKDNCYALITIKKADEITIKNIKINLYYSKECIIEKSNKDCDRVFLSEYKNGITIDHRLNLLLDDKRQYFLVNNELKLNKIFKYTNYDFANGEIFLLVKEEDYQYEFPLIISENGDLKLLEDHFVSLKEFNYSENYFSKSFKTDSIYFPFIKDLKKYDCLIYIRDFVEIRIPFMAITKGNFYGDCSISKYCLRRITYD